MLRMTKKYIALLMLLALAVGVTHTAQHDWASERVHEIAEAAHHATAPVLHVHHEAPHHQEGDKSKKTHSEPDCLLGDLSAAPACDTSPQKLNFILPRPTHPQNVQPSLHTQGLPPVRAPPLSI